MQLRAVTGKAATSYALFELARVLVRLDPRCNRIVNANHSAM
jgi:hypothetical protein